MSWVTNKAVLDAALIALGYKEMPVNKTVSEGTFRDKYYNYKIEIGIDELTGDMAIQTDMVTLEVSYIINSNSEQATAIDSFRSVMEAVQSSNPFVQFISNGTFERLDDDNKKLIASVQFEYGLRGCSL